MSIITDKTPLEQLRNRGLKEMNREGPRPLKPKLVLLREVFGRGAWGRGVLWGWGQGSQHGSCLSPSLWPGFMLCWLFPWSCSTAPGTGPTYSPLPSRYV